MLRVHFEEKDNRSRAVDRPGVATYVVDLGFPCCLACTVCERQPVSPHAYHLARRQLLVAAAAPSVHTLRVAFFGGDPFALPRSFGALIEEVRDACTKRGTVLDLVAISDGMSWSTDVVRRFCALGVRAMQVTLDGPPSIHDRIRPSRHGPSFRRIVSSLKFHRADASVVVRTDAAVGVEAVEELADILEAEGLFAAPTPVSLYVAAQAPYPEQARQLLELMEMGESGARTHTDLPAPPWGS